MKRRCAWAGSEAIYQEYHDLEWGVAQHDDRHLFEMLTLEGAQAGLSWLTILKKREGYRRAFDNFDVEKIALYTDADKARLVADGGIVRNRAKIASTIGNAQATLALRGEGGSLADFLWSFVGGKPIQNQWKSLAELPAQTAESLAMSKALKKRGFRFVGPTICYALMQAVGMVNDHTTDCFRFRELR